MSSSSTTTTTQFNVSESMRRSVERGMQRGMEKAASTLVNDITHKLAEEFDFDVDDAMRLLGEISLSNPKKKETKSMKKANKPKKEKIIQLPWCGVVIDDCCQAIKSCSKLYVQCRNDKLDGGDYCRRCQTETVKNDGSPPYGVIQDRFNEDYKDLDDKKPINYGNYMSSYNRSLCLDGLDTHGPEITHELACAEAAKLGWTIPPEQFTVVEVKKGRKPKPKGANIETTDTDDEKKDMFSEKAKQVEASTGDSSDDDSSDDEVPIGTKVNKRKPNDAETDSISSVGEKKSKRVCLEEEENSELEEENMSDSDSDSDGDVETYVEPFEHKGVHYSIDGEDHIYDTETRSPKSPIGVYDRETEQLTIF